MSILCMSACPFVQSSDFLCVVVVVTVVVVGLLLFLLLLLLLLVCFQRYRVVVVGFSPFENKAGPTDGRTDGQPNAHTD